MMAYLYEYIGTGQSVNRKRFIYVLGQQNITLIKSDFYNIK